MDREDDRNYGRATLEEDLKEIEDRVFFDSDDEGEFFQGYQEFLNDKGDYPIFKEYLDREYEN